MHCGGTHNIFTGGHVGGIVQSDGIARVRSASDDPAGAGHIIALDLTACGTSSLGSENSVERPARPTFALGPQSAEHSPETTGNISTELCVIRASIPLVRGALSTAFRRLGVVPRAE